MTSYLRVIVNPKSTDGNFLYMRCVDGKHRGKHAWVNKDAGGHTFFSTKMPKNLYAPVGPGDKIRDVMVKHTRYYVKNFARRDSNGTESICYYLSSMNTPEFEDFVRFFGPREE